MGIALSLAAGLAAAGVIYFRPAILGMPTDAEIALSLRPLAQFVIVSFLIFTVGAFFAIRQRGEITLVLALAAMVPAGCCLVEGRARVASFFSLADAATYLNPRLGRSGEVIFEGSLRNGSSLSFYLEKKFFFVGQPPGFFERDDAARRKYLDEHFLLDAWDRSDPIYLIIDEKRVARFVFATLSRLVEEAACRERVAGVRRGACAMGRMPSPFPTSARRSGRRRA